MNRQILFDSNYMAWLYHEKQESALCGVHCLNNLLQGSYYNASDLAEIARTLDENEHTLMQESGLDSSDFLKFVAEGSGNVADTGFFSVQVGKQQDEFKNPKT